MTGTVRKSKVTIALDICQAMEVGLFTPFLGAGASSLRSRNGYATGYWVPVAIQLRRLLDGFKEDSPQRRYVAALADAKAIMPAADSGLPTDARWADAVFPLQQALAELGADLLDQCAAAMVSTRKAMVDVASYELTLDCDPAILGEHLVPALDAALALSGIAAAGPRDSDLSQHLNPRAIHKGLERLTLSLLGARYLRAVRDSLKGHIYLLEEIDKPENQNSKHGSLSLDEVTWLTNLLWHTLRFEVKAYPTASELAFRIGLEVDLHPHYAALAQAAQAWRTTGAQAKLITKWLERCQDSPELTRFHDGLAAALALQHSRLVDLNAAAQVEQTNSDAQAVPSYLAGAEKAKRPDPLPVSLAMTTNYDRCLERALNRLRKSYHVIFPVDDARRWLIRTVTWYDRGVDPVPNWGQVKYVEHPAAGQQGGLQVCYMSERDFHELPIEGPIIVKIHGSPQDFAPPSLGTFKPFLVLSERTYLDSVSAESEMPCWIQKQISQGGRDIWFLGYSISDWNVRLTLFRQVKMTDGWHEGPEPKKSVVDRHVDDWGMPLLHDLKVEMYQGDLEELGDIIRTDTDVAAFLEEQDRLTALGAVL